MSFWRSNRNARKGREMSHPGDDADTPRHVESAANLNSL
jgi:hypothetical protein